MVNTRGLIPFSEQLVALGFPTDVETSNRHRIIEYLKGKEIIILRNSNSHNYGSRGDTVRLRTGAGINLNSASRGYTGITGGIPSGNNMPFSAFSVVEKLTSIAILDRINDLNVEKEAIDNKIKDLEAKRQYLIDEDIETLDEDEYAVYLVTKSLSNDDLTEQDKRDIILNLLKKD